MEAPSHRQAVQDHRPAVHVSCRRERGVLLKESGTRWGKCAPGIFVQVGRFVNCIIHALIRTQTPERGHSAGNREPCGRHECQLPAGQTSLAWFAGYLQVGRGGAAITVDRHSGPPPGGVNDPAGVARNFPVPRAGRIRPGVPGDARCRLRRLAAVGHGEPHRCRPFDPLAP